ncbi:MAG: hypothetical protein GEV08_21570 [Acidimicrobiia bacterium]|nr:hypothetical protein [Acidimicrobiia bacterium]
MTWIRTIPWDEAEGELRQAYDWQAASLGEPAEFTRLGSLYPPIVDERLRLYRTVEHCPSSLSPTERQLACYVTSLLNDTPHCGSGLRHKLLGLGLDPALLDAVEARPEEAATGDERLDAICGYAAVLTRSPGAVAEADLARLRSFGLDDLDLVDLNNLVAYYNYINRVANGLGLRTTLNPHEATHAVPPAP